MPTLDWGHSHYWAGSTGGAGAGGPAVGMPRCPEILMGSLFGGLQGLPGARWCRRIRYWWRLWRGIRQLDEERRFVVDHVQQLLQGEDWTYPRLAVRLTATTPGLHEARSWEKLSHKLHDRPLWAENTWRHLHAADHADAMARADGSTLSNLTRNLLVELAYHALKMRGR